MNYTPFKQAVWKHYREHGRHDLPWRLTQDPYKILVSEFMLQQTQVDRVIPKYEAFIERFPTVQKLAGADMKDVLLCWLGLGYNKRAANLKKCAETIVREHGGKFPKDFEKLLSLPGIGHATAGDLLAFAWNEPAVVIETNIRTAYIHHFFPEQEMVSDSELAALVEATLDTKNPREWYYALMDYGAYLKKMGARLNAHSAHYKKQGKFEGSNRELRSKILKLVLEKPRTEAEIMKLLETPAEPIRRNLLALSQEGLIHKAGKKFTS